ncbi:phospholipase D family protein [Allosphingosinicella vermicomposti]|uniref:phospholipase D family protein n=1 Tax=Allosphingosinicella vermicomposti TaxID=614671 RepID=UPI000D0E81EC|nr:phospholipase D family protein [Allosphingosinicella vermicomposti]
MAARGLPFVRAEEKGGPDWTRPFPVRHDGKVTPLIEAADMFPALENLVLDAKISVWMSFRVFDPDTKLRSDRAKAKGLEDWSALLHDAVKRGVEVRILLADFEPVLADYLHAGSWSTYRRIRAIIDELDEEERPRLQLMVVQHEGEMGWGIRQALRFALRSRIRNVVEGLIAAKKRDDGGFDTRPGLWRYLSWEKNKPKAWKAGPPPRLWPATYHQKAVVVDGGVAIVGGIDLDERRWDDRRHRQRTDQTWHDISARVEGAAAADVARHFKFLWNRELPRYREIVAGWTDGCGRELMLDPLTPVGALPKPEAVKGNAEVQIVRTLSVRSPLPFAIGPRQRVRELKAAHRNVIRAARRTLYIEAQFFRSDDAANWVEQALEASPDLQVIVLIANVPEEVAFEKQTDNLAHRHGEYLQARALGRLIEKGGADRVGLFTLAKQEKVKPGEKEFEATRGSAYGSGVIHIHSKLLIADDDICLLSSANINGRSFDWDTELGFIWREEGGAISRFRNGLWRQLWGGTLPDELAGWRKMAEANRSAKPEDRRGFVVPYQLNRAKKFARPYLFVPDDLV